LAASAFLAKSEAMPQGRASLAKPAKYYPFMSGKYEVAAGLRPFGMDFSNGELDKKALQLDSEYDRYIENKDQCRKENIHKYCCFHNFDSVSAEVNNFLLTRLTEEYPQFFELARDEKLSVLRCSLTDEKIIFNEAGELLSCSRTRVPYLNLFDALCSLIPEDVAVISLNPETRTNALNAIHLCAGGHWAAADKIGKDFFATHAPVPHIEKINEKATQFVETMIHKGPFVRFVWGFATDTRLNHHPEPPVGIGHEAWHGRSFRDPQTDKLFVRVERQVTWGLPKINASVFFIRVSYLTGHEIKYDTEKREKLLSALQSMSANSRVYKGVDSSFEILSAYLNCS
jgi:hypothetical protein